MQGQTSDLPLPDKQREQQQQTTIAEVNHQKNQEQEQQSLPSLQLQSQQMTEQQLIDQSVQHIEWQSPLKNQKDSKLEQQSLVINNLQGNAQQEGRRNVYEEPQQPITSPKEIQSPPKKQIREQEQSAEISQVSLNNNQHQAEQESEVKNVYQQEPDNNQGQYNDKNFQDLPDAQQNDVQDKDVASNEDHRESKENQCEESENQTEKLELEKQSQKNQNGESCQVNSRNNNQNTNEETKENESLLNTNAQNIDNNHQSEFQKFPNENQWNDQNQNGENTQNQADKGMVPPQPTQYSHYQNSQVSKEKAEQTQAKSKIPEQQHQPEYDSVMDPSDRVHSSAVNEPPIISSLQNRQSSQIPKKASSKHKVQQVAVSQLPQQKQPQVHEQVSKKKKKKKKAKVDDSSPLPIISGNNQKYDNTNNGQSKQVGTAEKKEEKLQRVGAQNSNNVQAKHQSVNNSQVPKSSSQSQNVIPEKVSTNKSDDSDPRVSKKEINSDKQLQKEDSVLPPPPSQNNNNNENADSNVNNSQPSQDGPAINLPIEPTSIAAHLIIHQANRQRISTTLEYFLTYLTKHTKHSNNQKQLIKNVQDEIQKKRLSKQGLLKTIKEYFNQYSHMSKDFYEKSYKFNKSQLNFSNNPLLNMKQQLKAGFEELIFLRKSTGNDFHRIHEFINNTIQKQIQDTFQQYWNCVTAAQNKHKEKRQDFHKKEKQLIKRVAKVQKVYNKGKQGIHQDQDLFIEMTKFITLQRQYRKYLIDYGISLIPLKKTFIKAEETLYEDLQNVLNNFKNQAKNIYGLNRKQFNHIEKFYNQTNKNNTFEKLADITDADYVRSVLLAFEKTSIKQNIKDKQFEKVLNMVHFEEVVGVSMNLLKGTTSKTFELKNQAEQLVDSISGNLVIFDKETAQLKDKYMIKNISAKIVNEGVVEIDEVIKGIIFDNNRTNRITFRDNDRAEQLICFLNTYQESLAEQEKEKENMKK